METTAKGPAGNGLGDVIAQQADRVKAHVETRRREAQAHAATASQLNRRTADRAGEDGTVAEVEYTQEQYAAAYKAAKDTIREQYATTRSRRGALRYLATFAIVTIVGLVTIYTLNGRFAMEYYLRDYSERIADAFDNGSNFGVFDLNIDIRNLRDAHIAKLDETPDVVLLGASHWQEADVGLVTDRNMYNAHIHRDYYEDPLAMIEMLERHHRLPETLILTIRDNQFTPVAARTDFLWLPGIPYYRRMAKRLGITPHHPVETAPIVHWRDRLSLDMLYTNAKRWFEAPVKPGPTQAQSSDTLDLLVPGGSIVWSAKHEEFFTAERSRNESLDFAAFKRVNPPMIDPKGVEHIHTLLRHLHKKGVYVYLAHPPFNPIFWDAVQGSPYMEGNRRVREIVQGWADEFGWKVIGGFDPRPLGCRADQYIDAEHANRDCLSAIFQQFMTLDRERTGAPPLAEPQPARTKDGVEEGEADIPVAAAPSAPAASQAPVRTAAASETPPAPAASIAPAAAVRSASAAPPTLAAPDAPARRGVRVADARMVRTDRVAAPAPADWREESAPRVLNIQLRATFD